MFPLFSGLLAGAVCVLAPDHLAPVLSLSFTDVHDFRSAFRVGWQWGIGHSSGIFFVLMMVLALKVTVTHYMFEMFVFWSQVFVGGVLIGLGLHYWANQAKYLNQKLEEARDGAAAGSPGHNMINCACCFPPAQSGLGRNIFSARKSRMSPSDSVTDGSSPTASSPPSIRFFGPDSNPPSAIDEEVDDDLDFSCEACTDDEIGGDEGADDERSPVAGSSRSTFGKFSLKANLFQAPPSNAEAPVMDVESYYKKKKPGGSAADAAAPASSTKTSTHPVTDTEGGSTTAASGTEDADEADPALLELACEAIDDAHFNKNGAISFSGATGKGFSFAGAAPHARPSALKPVASSPSPANTATTVASPPQAQAVSSPLQQAPAASSPLQQAPASSPTAFSGKKLPKSSPRYPRTKYAISFGTPSPPPFGQFVPAPSVEEPEKVAHQSVGEQKLVLGEKQEGPILVLAEAPPLPQQRGPAAVSRLRGSATVLGVNTSFEKLPGSGVDEYDSILDLGSAEPFGGFCSVNFLFPPCCLIGARRMRSSACAGAFSHSIRMRFGRLYRWLSFLSTSFNKEDGTKIEDSKLLLILGFVQGFSCPSNLMSMLFLAKQLSWFEILCFMASYCFSSCCLMGCFCYVLKVWLFRGDDLAAAMSTAVEDVNTVVENALGNTVGNAKKSDDTATRKEPQELQEVVGGGALTGSSRNTSTTSPPGGNGGFLTNGVVRNRAELGGDSGAISSSSSTNTNTSSSPDKKKKPEGRCSRERIYRLGCLFLMLTGGLFIFESVVGVDVFDCLGLHEHHHAAHHDGHHNHETDDDKDVTWDDEMEASGNMGPEMSGRISWPQQETTQEPHVGDSGELPHRHGDSTDQHVENAAEGEGSAVVAPPTPAGSKDHPHEGVGLGTRGGGGSSLRSRRSDSAATGGGGAGAGAKAASSEEKVGGPPPEVQGGAAPQERSPFRGGAAGVPDATGDRAGAPGSPGGAPERKEAVAVELEPGTATREQQQNNWAAREPPHPGTETGAKGTHDEKRPSRFPPRKSATAAAASSSSATPAARPTTKVEKSTRERDRGNMYGGVNGPPIRSTGDVAYDLEHQNTDGYRSSDSASSNLQKSLPGGGKGYNFEQAAASNPFEAVAVAERVYSAPARYMAAREIEEEEQFVEASSQTPADSDDFFVAQEDASAPLPHEDAFIVPRRPDPLPPAPPASAIADMVNARPSRLRSERALAPMGLIELGPVSSGRTTMPSLVRRSRENGAANGAGSGGGGPGKSPFLRTSTTGRSGAGPGNYINSLRGHQSHGQRQPQLQQRQPENSISRAPALQLPSDEAAVEGGGVAEIVRRLRAHQGQTTTSQDYYVRDVDVDVDMEAVTIEPKMSEITNTGTGGILTTDLRQWTF